MSCSLASDHAGFKLKEVIKKFLKNRGEKVFDLGTDNENSVDYPDYVHKAVLLVKEKKVDKAIVICGSGIGACITANKVKGIKASVCHDCYSAHQGVEHDDMNVLALGARIIGESLALEIVNNFITAKFSNEERHKRRVNKIKLIEESFGS